MSNWGQFCDSTACITENNGSVNAIQNYTGVEISERKDKISSVRVLHKAF